MTRSLQHRCKVRQTSIETAAPIPQPCSLYLLPLHVYLLLFCPFPSSFSISICKPAVSTQPKRPMAQSSPVTPPLPSLVLLLRNEFQIKTQQRSSSTPWLGCAATSKLNAGPSSRRRLVYYKMTRFRQQTGGNDTITIEKGLEIIIFFLNTI